MSVAHPELLLHKPWDPFSLSHQIPLLPTCAAAKPRQSLIRWFHPFWFKMGLESINEANNAEGAFLDNKTYVSLILEKICGLWVCLCIIFKDTVVHAESSVCSSSFIYKRENENKWKHPSKMVFLLHQHRWLCDAREGFWDIHREQRELWCQTYMGYADFNTASAKEVMYLYCSVFFFFSLRIHYTNKQNRCTGKGVLQRMQTALLYITLKCSLAFPLCILGSLMSGIFVLTKQSELFCSASFPWNVRDRRHDWKFYISYCCLSPFLD